MLLGSEWTGAKMSIPSAGEPAKCNIQHRSRNRGGVLPLTTFRAATANSFMSSEPSPVHFLTGNWRLCATVPCCLSLLEFDDKKAQRRRFCGRVSCHYRKAIILNRWDSGIPHHFVERLSDPGNLGCACFEPKSRISLNKGRNRRWMSVLA